MFWLLLAIVVATIVMAGRAHSKRLDELDDLHARGYLNQSWRRDSARDFVAQGDG
jgi:hypothetical protein